MGYKFVNYLIRVRDPRIPDYIYAMFPKVGEDEELLKKVYKMWRIGNDREYGQVYLSLKKEADIITKLTNYSIDGEKNTIRAILNNGFVVFIKIDLLGTDDPDELIKILQLPMQMHVRYVKGYLIATNIFLPTLKSYKDIGGEIVEEIGGYNALLLGFGILPSLETYSIFLPRILGLFKGFERDTDVYPWKSIHVMQFTAPNTGKTHFAVRVSSVMNYEYLGGELPTPTRLIYDARNNAVGIVGLRDGIIFDEFDKKSYQDVQKLLTDLRVMLSGMEQGVWTRGSGSKSIEIRRHVNFMVFGNVPPSLQHLNYRTAISKYFNVSGFDAFVDRFTMVDVYNEQFDISKYVVPYIFPNSILRGIIQYLQETMKPNICSVEKARGRLYRHCMNLKSVLNVLNIDLPDDMVYYLVSGEYTTLHLKKTTPANAVESTFRDWKYIRDMKEALHGTVPSGTEEVEGEG